ncbi:hypothetical protein EB796_021125 [Bugula neritina]|uniref:Uncharacterized protein n=1 Tax=Bugula neritina TaxID=10212 RepID=A0A7J7J3X5_BUGNE|nr:hypothetical protein EB796_021125 [Bugula neritina]
MNWQQAGKRNRRRRQRKAYLNEKLYPSTPLYPSKDMRLFTLHVQKAVAKILESQGFPVKASVPIEEAAVVPAESVSLPTASIHDLPINNPLPPVKCLSVPVPVYEPHHTHSYHLNHPTVLRSFRPEPDGVLNHQPSATSLRNSGLHSASTPALTTRLRQKQNVSLPQLSSLVEKHPNSHTFQSHSNKSFKTKSKVAPKVVETAPSDAAISSTVDERRDFKLAGALKKESVTNLLVDSMTDEGSAVFDRLDFTAHTSDATVFGSATTMSSARFDGNVSTLTTDNTTINTAAATMGTSIDTAASTVTSTVTSTRSSTLASLDTNNILPSSVLQHKSNLVKFQDVSPKGTGATKMSPSSSSHSMHRKSRNKITSKKTPVCTYSVC